MFKLYIETGYQAFYQAEGQEVARILRDLADQVEHLKELPCPTTLKSSKDSKPLRDREGNEVGYYTAWSSQYMTRPTVKGAKPISKGGSPYQEWNK